MMDAPVEIPWIVPADHPAFPGHFPGKPILPGVVLLDQALKLAAGALKPDVAIRGLGNAKFFHPVPPGSALRFRYQIPGATALRFDVLMGEQIVASGSFSLGAAP